MRYDVIVAGAGPAGSTAARECAALGLTTLLLDRAEFPRDKPCGGGVNLRAARLLPFDLAPVVERSILGMRISIRQRAAFVRYAAEPISYLTQRRLLDAFLAERAIEAGAHFLEKRRVCEVERQGRWLVVRAGGEVFEGRTLIVADGANGPTAKLAGIRVQRSKEIAFEGNITPRGEYPDDWREVFGIDVGGVPGGYGWLFPKGDHVNIGVGGFASTGPTLRTRLDSLTRFYGFDPKEFWGLRGHPLPVRRAGAALIDGPVLLVGDAAGLLDPMSGEGIFGAIWSGRSAARHIASYLRGETASLDGYRADIERELGLELAAARQLHTLFQVAPPLWARFVRRSPRAWRLICGLIDGDVRYTHLTRRSRGIGAVIRLSSRIASARGKTAPPPE